MAYASGNKAMIHQIMVLYHRAHVTCMKMVEGVIAAQGITGTALFVTRPGAVWMRAPPITVHACCVESSIVHTMIDVNIVLVDVGN